MDADRGAPHDLDARIDEIFDRALDVEPDERSAYLAAACGDDSALRVRVERLLAWSDDPPARLESAAASELWQGEGAESTAAESTAAESTAGGAAPTQVGPYRILQEIGRGGMGVVYLGERADGHFEQQVALKVMRPGSETPEARLRFEQERQIIASLQHPNIARLYDGGVSQDGRPYSAMERIEGQPITAYCDEHRLGIAGRLRLMETVACAVSYAHRNLVVHCDLKPSNILVTPSGEIKLLDFGIAKLLDAAGADSRIERRSGQRAVTPLYASPEQLHGESVTTASDIYQLGLLLFELLTGERARELSGSFGSEDEAPMTASWRTPSTAVRRASQDRATAMAAQRDTDPRALVRRLRHDLDRIVEAALRERPEERYASATALAEDLARYRRNEPVSVRPPTLRYRATRFVQRNRLAVAAAALLTVLLIGYSITVTVQAQKIRRERDRAQRIQAFALGLYGASDPLEALGPEVSAAELVAHGVARAEAELAEELDVQAEVKNYLGRVYRRLGLFQEAEALLRDVLVLQQRLHGEVHSEVAAAKNELGRLLLERDDPEALTLLEEALALRRELLGDESLHTARTLSNLGYYLRSVSRHPEAEEHFRQALAIQRRNDPNGFEVAGTLSGLGWVVRLQHRPEEAEPMLRESLEIFRRVYGDEHLEVSSGWNNLASVLWQLERWDEGDEAIRQSIESKKSLYGEVHPKIATSLGNLAGALAKRGEFEQAVVLYRQAMEMRVEVLGASHPRVAQSQAQLAEVLHKAGQPEAAESLLEGALAIFQQHLPAGHPSIGRVWRGLGAVRLDAGDLDSARRALERSRAISATVETSYWPWRVDVLLAEIDRRQGRIAEARTRLQGAEGQLGDDPEWTERWRRELALLASE